MPPVRAPAILAGCLTLAGCVPGPTLSTTPAQFDHVVMVMDFACPDGAGVSTRITGTVVVLSTPAGSKVYTGSHPTYFGHEATLSFAGGYGSLLMSAPGAQQTCVLSGTR